MAGAPTDLLKSRRKKERTSDDKMRSTATGFGTTNGFTTEKQTVVSGIKNLGGDIHELLKEFQQESEFLFSTEHTNTEVHRAMTGLGSSRASFRANNASMASLTRFDGDEEGRSSVKLKIKTR